MVSAEGSGLGILEQRIKQDIFAILKQDHGLVAPVPLFEGRMCPIYKCMESSTGKMVAVKMGIGRKGVREIRNNISGYGVLESEGFGDLLPPNLKYLRHGDVELLMMGFLGNSMAQKLKSGKTESLVEFQTLLINFCSKYVVNNLRSKHVDSLNTVRQHMLFFISKLAQIGYKSKVSRKIERLDTERLSSNKSSVFILDFTPPNLFVSNGKLSYIDPWEQKSYTGSPITNIGQFICYYSQVGRYKPIMTDDRIFAKMVDPLSEQIGLTKKQALGQFNLGVALQYSLMALSNRDSFAKTRLYLEKIENFIESI